MLTLTCIAAGACAPASRPTEVEVSSALLQGLVLERVMPAYPAQSRRLRRGGLAVAELTLSPTGYVGQVEVLEAPDEAIGSSVHAALMDWRFDSSRELTNSDVVWLRGVLFFRFEAVTGEVRMITAADTVSVSVAGSVSSVDDSRVLDIRPRREFRRDRLPGVINVPFEELELRSRELRSSREVILDCSPDQLTCAAAADLLRSVGVAMGFAPGTKHEE